MVAALVTLPQIVAARRVLGYTPLAGEPDLTPFLERCSAAGVSTHVPEDDVDPTWPDVVVVPGLAFTAAGDRLGQGGGWYDRFLSRTRHDTVSIGVCFATQVLDSLPTEPHDVTLDLVVADTGPVTSRPPDDRAVGGPDLVGPPSTAASSESAGDGPATGRS